MSAEEESVEGHSEKQDAVMGELVRKEQQSSPPTVSENEMEMKDKQGQQMDGESAPVSQTQDKMEMDVIPVEMAKEKPKQSPPKIVEGQSTEIGDEKSVSLPKQIVPQTNVEDEVVHPTDTSATAEITTLPPKPDSSKPAPVVVPIEKSPGPPKEDRPKEDTPAAPPAVFASSPPSEATMESKGEKVEPADVSMPDATATMVKNSEESASNKVQANKTKEAKESKKPAPKTTTTASPAATPQETPSVEAGVSKTTESLPSPAAAVENSQSTQEPASSVPAPVSTPIEQSPALEAKAKKDESHPTPAASSTPKTSSIRPRRSTRSRKVSRKQKKEEGAKEGEVKDTPKRKRKTKNDDQDETANRKRKKRRKTDEIPLKTETKDNEMKDVAPESTTTPTTEKNSVVVAPPTQQDPDAMEDVEETPAKIDETLSTTTVTAEKSRRTTRISRKKSSSESSTRVKRKRKSSAKDDEKEKEKQDSNKVETATPTTTTSKTKRNRGRPKNNNLPDDKEEATPSTKKDKKAKETPAKKDRKKVSKKSKEKQTLAKGEVSDQELEIPATYKKKKSTKSSKKKSKTTVIQAEKGAESSETTAQKKTVVKKRRSPTTPKEHEKSTGNGVTAVPATSDSKTSTTTTTTSPAKGAPKTPAADKKKSKKKTPGSSKKEQRQCLGRNAAGGQCGRAATKKLDYYCHLHYIQKFGQDKYNEVTGKPPVRVEGPCARCGTDTTDEWIKEGKSVLCSQCVLEQATKATEAAIPSTQKKKRKKRLEDEAILAPPLKRVRRSGGLTTLATIAPAVPVSSAELTTEIPSTSEKDPSLVNAIAATQRSDIPVEVRIDKPLLTHLLPPPVRANIFTNANLMKHATAVHNNVWLQQQILRYNPRTSQQPLQLDMLLYILTFCDVKSLGQTALVSHMWNIASQDHIVWKYQYNAKWSISQTQMHSYVALPTRASHRLSTLDDGLDWKDLYFTRAHLYQLGLNPIQLVEHMSRFYSIEANPQILDSIVDKAQMHRNYHHHVLSMQESRQKLVERTQLLDALKSIAGNTEQFLTGLVAKDTLDQIMVDIEKEDTQANVQQAKTPKTTSKKKNTTKSSVSKTKKSTKTKSKTPAKKSTKKKTEEA